MAQLLRALVQRTQVQFPEPTCHLTTSCNYCSRRSSISSRHCASARVRARTHTYTHTHTHTHTYTHTHTHLHTHTHTHKLNKKKKTRLIKATHQDSQGKVGLEEQDPRADAWLPPRGVWIPPSSAMTCSPPGTSRAREL